MTTRSAQVERGFSLIEVLVSVLVVAVGLLGVSKMQAAGVSNSQIARTRSLVALQASSLAAVMRGNPGYWAQTPGSPVRISGKAVSDPSGVLTKKGACASTTCAPASLAAYDLDEWANNMDKRFPGYSADITCTPGAGLPTRCLIDISWQEKYVAINKATASGSNQKSAQKFTLVVEP